MEDKTKTQASGGTIVSGYLFAVLSVFFFPILFALVGLVLGIITISKNDAGHGIMIIFLSVAGGLIGAIWGIKTVTGY